MRERGTCSHSLSSSRESDRYQRFSGNTIASRSTSCNCSGRRESPIQSCYWEPKAVSVNCRSSRAITKTRSGKIHVMKPTPRGCTSLQVECLVTPPYGPCGILDFDDCASGDEATWKCKVAEAVLHASRIYYTALRYVDHIESQPPSIRSQLWRKNEAFTFSFSDNMVPGDAHFWFGPYSSERASAIRKVLTRATNKVLGLGAGLIRYTCSYDDHPSEAGKARLEKCEAWGSTYGDINGQRVIYLCREWHTFNFIQRWSNLVHELTHVGGVGHCFECPYGAECGDVQKCDDWPTHQAIAAAQAWDYAAAGTYAYTAWLYGIGRAEEAGFCLPTSDLGGYSSPG